MIDDITAKSEIAAVKQDAAGKKKKQLDAEGIIIAKEEAEAAVALEAAIPALEAAKNALANVNKKDLDEIKALANPPTAIADVCTMCFYFYYLKPKEFEKVSKPDWNQIKVGVLA
jgi:hypothetical protein